MSTASTYGYESYQLFLSLCLHFNDKVEYDALTYNFKTSAKKEDFPKNKYRWQYAAIERDIQFPLYAMYSIFEENDFNYVSVKKLFKNIRRHDCDPKEFLDRQFVKDLECLANIYSDDKAEIFSSGDLYPVLYEHYMNGDIHFRTFLLLDLFIFKIAKKENSRDIIVWKKFVDKVDRVSGFMEIFYPRELIESYVLKHFLHTV